MKFFIVLVYMKLCRCAFYRCLPINIMKRFVPAYLENATNTQAPRDMDICYFAVSELRETDYDYIQSSVEEDKGVSYAVVKKTIPIDVLLTFYGPDADDDAELFWSRFQTDFGAGSARAVLRGLNIVPIGKPRRPVALYETEGTYQRRRCDVEVQLAYLHVERWAAGTVDNPPAVTVNFNND